MTVATSRRAAALLAAGALVVFAATPVFAKAGGMHSAHDVRAALLAAEQVDADADEAAELDELEDEMADDADGAASENANEMSVAARDGEGHGASEEAHARNEVRKAAHAAARGADADGDEADEDGDEDAEVSPEPSAEVTPEPSAEAPQG